MTTGDWSGAADSAAGSERRPELQTALHVQKHAAVRCASTRMRRRDGKTKIPDATAA